jgi:hypothetical protein
MALTVSVQVPTGDSESLTELLRTLGVQADIIQLHPFDGETAVQSVIALTSATIPALRIWLRARVDQRKTYRIVYDGTEYTGYTVDEVERLMKTLKAETGDE